MIVRIRDWWRGWSDDDLVSILNKINQKDLNPGGIIYVTIAELEAHRAYLEEQYPLRCMTL